MKSEPQEFPKESRLPVELCLPKHKASSPPKNRAPGFFAESQSLAFQTSLPEIDHPAEGRLPGFRLPGREQQVKQAESASEIRIPSRSLTA